MLSCSAIGLLSSAHALEVSGTAQGPSPSLSPALAEEVVLHQNDADLIPVVVVLDDYPDLETFQQRADAQMGVPGRVARVQTLLRDNFAASSGQVRALLDAELGRGQAERISAFWIFNGFTASLTPAAIRRVADHPAVAYVRHADPIPPPEVAPALPFIEGDEASEWNIDKINAPDAWARGYRGQGVVIGGMDTGVRLEHPDLTEQYKGGIGAWFDPWYQHTEPYDADGHGTHTMGTILGRDASGKDIGVAPDATWIAARIWNDNGFGPLEATVRAFEWFMDPDGDPLTDDAPRAVSNSWGFDYDGCLMDFRRSILAWRAAGIMPVFASGNGGPGVGSSESPGNYPESYAIGATDSSDRIASFSGRGPSDCDQNLVKPDVSAPGVSVRSCVGNGWQSWNGTSMATPHITGAAAVLLSADADLSVEELEEFLALSAVDLGSPGPDNDFGYGRIDVDAAVTMVLNRGSVSGQVKDAGSGLPLDASIYVVEVNRSVDALGGDYTVRLPGDAGYTLEASIFGYATETVQVWLNAQQNLEQGFDLDPLPAGPLTGTVEDSGGQPIAGALVTLADFVSDISAADGSFDLGDVPLDLPLEIVTTYCGLLDDVRTIELTEPGGLDLTVELEDPAPDDMESGANGWRSEEITIFYLDQWHLSTTRSLSGSTSWKCGDTGGGDYGDYVDAGLVTRCYEVDKGTSLRFGHWIDTEHNPMRPGSVWDGGLVELSLDNGETWEQIHPAGGYPNTITSNPANVLEPGTRCWGGHVQAWQEATFDLHQLQGEARFRFRFASDGLVTAEGWYIDDLSLAPTDPNCSLVVENTPTQVQPGHDAIWDVTVGNGETRPVTFDFWVRATGPGGEFSLPMLLARELEEESQRRATARVRVKAGVSPGLYTVQTRMGVFPDLVWAEDSFTVEVQ